MSTELPITDQPISNNEIRYRKEAATVRQLGFGFNPLRASRGGSESKGFAQSVLLLIGFPDDAGSGQIRAWSRKLHTQFGSCGDFCRLSGL